MLSDLERWKWKRPAQPGLIDRDNVRPRVALICVFTQLLNVMSPCRSLFIPF
jgi:hypothetical protein